MQEEDVAAGRRLRRRDKAGGNAAETRRNRLDTGRRPRHPTLIGVHALAPRLNAGAGGGAVLDKKPRPEPHQLGLDARALRLGQ